MWKSSVYIYTWYSDCLYVHFASQTQSVCHLFEILETFKVSPGIWHWDDFLMMGCIEKSNKYLLKLHSDIMYYFSTSGCNLFYLPSMHCNLLVLFVQMFYLALMKSSENLWNYSQLCLVKILQKWIDVAFIHSDIQSKSNDQIKDLKKILAVHTLQILNTKQTQFTIS